MASSPIIASQGFANAALTTHYWQIERVTELAMNRPVCPCRVLVSSWRGKMLKKSLFLSTLLWLAGLEVFADLPVGPVYLSHFPEIDVVVEPPGLDPPALSAIAAGDLQLVEDGVPTSQALAVRPFGSLDRALALVVAVDVSGTMTGQPLAELKKALGPWSTSSGPRTASPW